MRRAEFLPEPETVPINVHASRKLSTYGRLLSAVAVLLSLATLGITCIGGGKPAPTPAPPTETPLPPTVMLTPIPSSPIPTPALQDLTFGVPANPLKLDPAVSTDPVADLVSAQLYDTLVRFKPGTTEIEPALAIKWSVSEDGHTWDFILREDVTFHDGTLLTAQEVVWNFLRWMDPNHPAHQGNFLYWDGMFGGSDDEEDPDRSSQTLVTSVEALDSRTVRLVLSKPFAPLLHNLAMEAFVILSPEAVTSAGADIYGTAFGPRPVGTGPFRLTDWQADQVVLAANQGYWAGPPGIGNLIFRVIPDDHDRFVALDNGEIDGMISPTEEDLAQAGHNSQIQIIMDPKPTTAFLNFNLEGENLRKREVRQAIAHAINRQALVEKAFGPTWEVATQMLPPALWGYNESIQSYPYDPERARELLAAANLPNQFTVSLWYPDQPRPYLPDPRAAAEAIAEDLQAVGINAIPKTEHWSAYLVDRGHGAFYMWLLGWTGYNGDPDSFFYYHFSLPTPREGNYRNDELRSLLLRGQSEVRDSGLREEIYRKAAVLLHEDVPRLFLAHPREPVLLSSEVIGFTPNPAGPETFLGVRKNRP